VIIPASSLSQKEGSVIEVYDMNGRKLQSVLIKYGMTAVDLGGYPSGVYLFNVQCGDIKETVKILKK
jgi:hypothetical protein